MDRLGNIAAFKERTLIIKGGDPVTVKGFTPVPNYILKNPKISIGAKLTFAMLLQYAREKDECFPGQAKLAEDMGSSDRSVRTWLNELKTLGLVTSKQQGQGYTNIYTLHIVKQFQRHVR